MCLTKVNFTTKYNRKSREFTCVGYKILKPASCLKKQTNSTYNVDFNYHLTYDLVLLKNATKWKKANFSFYSKSSKPFSVETDLSGNKYPPGFHIFVNRMDAERYSTGVLVEVEYKDVLCFGKQLTGNLGQRNYDAQCVIARQMKLVKPLKFIEYV